MPRKINTQRHYAPYKWCIGFVLSKIQGVAKKLKKNKGKLTQKDIHILQCERELEAIKKHIIFLQVLLDKYDQSL